MLLLCLTDFLDKAPVFGARRGRRPFQQIEKQAIPLGGSLRMGHRPILPQQSEDRPLHEGVTKAGIGGIEGLALG